MHENIKLKTFKIMFGFYFYIFMHETASQVTAQSFSKWDYIFNRPDRTFYTAQNDHGPCNKLYLLNVLHFDPLIRELNDQY